MSDDLSRKELKMPVLGRHFFIGTLYDAIEDEIIPNVTFWNESDLKKVESTRINKTEFSVVLADKIHEKLKELKLNSSLRISILCDMIQPVNGSAFYLEKKKNANQQSSVYLKIISLTEVKSIRMEQLARNNLRYPEIQKSGETGTATHVVTEVEYGAECTFKFTKNLSETEKLEEAKAQLELGVKELSDMFAINAENGGESKEAKQADMNNVECHFEGDFGLPADVKCPITYEEATEFAKKFVEMASKSMAQDTKDRKPLGNPIYVWLKPLIMMQDCHNAPCLRRNIGDVTANHCAQILRKYKKVQDEIDDLLEDTLVSKLPSFEEKIRLFQEYLASIVVELKKKIKELVVGVRRGTFTENSTQHTLNQVTKNQFLFHYYHLQEWIKRKNRELCLIEEFSNEVKEKITNKKKVIFFPSQIKLQQQMIKYGIDLGIEFAFASIPRGETYLKKLEEALTNGDTFSHLTATNDSSDVLWWEDKEIIQRVRREIGIFIVLVNANSENEKFAFAITAPEVFNETNSRFSLTVHQQQIEFNGWNALLKVSHHYPTERLMDIVRLLVEEDITEDWDSFPLLALCRYYSDENLIEMVRLFIDKGVDVNCKTAGGWNALLTVCRNYKKENLADLVSFFIAKNIDVHCKTIEGWNAVLISCRHYKKENLIDVVQLLLHQNIDINCKTPVNWNALHLVCFYSPKASLVNLVKLLNQYNIDKNAKTSDDFTARRILVMRFKEDEIEDVLHILDS